MGAATVSALGLPLSAVVLATLLTLGGGGATPLVIVGVVAAIVTTRVLSRPDRTTAPVATAGGACLRMQSPTQVDRWIDRRLSNRILRPRYAARLIAIIWLVTVIVFGTIEWIVDPETFDSVWLAFWWAIQTITTVGYGDVVPERHGRQGRRRDPDAGRAVVALGHHRRITSAFVTRRQAELQATGEDPVMQELKQIAARLERMEAELGPLGFRRLELINRVSAR